MMPDKAFFPISLGNHYYTNSVLTRIRTDIAEDFSDSTLVICDHLRFLSYKIRGVATQVIRDKIDFETGQFLNRLSNCGYDQSTVRIMMMSEALKSETFCDIQTKIWKLITAQKRIFNFLNELSMFTLEKNQVDLDVPRIDTQLQYFISETALSVYITEIQSFSHEFYKQMDRGLVVLLYEQYPEQLKEMLHQDTLKRQFHSLKEILS